MMFGLVISALVKTAEKTMPLLVMFAIVQVVFTGVLFQIFGIARRRAVRLADAVPLGGRRRRRHRWTSDTLMPPWDQAKPDDVDPLWEHTAGQWGSTWRSCSASASSAASSSRGCCAATSRRSCASSDPAGQRTAAAPRSGEPPPHVGASARVRTQPWSAGLLAPGSRSAAPLGPTARRAPHAAAPGTVPRGARPAGRTPAARPEARPPRPRGEVPRTTDRGTSATGRSPAHAPPVR